jgi:DNA polymerase I-like protein with 3'-5' exonuclease and polymerase domains
MQRQILSPEQAIPLLLDKAISPVVGLDTEFEPTNGTSTAPLRGISLAGGTPERGFFGAFWPYGPGSPEVMPWGTFRDRVLGPIISDPTRILALHPIKVEAQIIRARIPHDLLKAQLECTMTMVHCYDENLPKGLKDLGDCLLGMGDLASHADVMKELQKIRREGERSAKAAMTSSWALYKAERQKAKGLPPPPANPAWAEWQRHAMFLPAGLKKAEVEAQLSPRIFSAVREEHARRAHARYALYGAEDAVITVGLYYFLKAELDAERQFRLWDMYAFEKPICHPIVTEMEEAGLKISLERLRAIHAAMDKAIDELRADVVARWGMEFETTADGEEGEDFNPGSTDAVARRVWVDWRLRPPPWTLREGEVQPRWRRAKDGLTKTTKDIMEWLSINAPPPFNEHISQLIRWRRFDKLRSGFIIPIRQRAESAPDRRIHPSFWNVGAVTGRFASSDPNAENIPRATTMPTITVPPGADITRPPPGVVLDEEKHKVTRQVQKVWRIDSLRTIFVAEDEWDLVSADLSQVENRITGHESEDPALLALYRTWDCAECKGTGQTSEPLHACPNCGAPDGKRDKLHKDQPAIKGFCLGRDIHAHTSITCGLFDKYGAKEGREHGKTTNHAATYGMGPRTFARRENIPTKEAERILNAWHSTFFFVRGRLHERVRHDIQEHGYVTMFDGLHIRRFPVARVLLRSGNFDQWAWEGTIREGVNVLAQGGTGVIVKIAMPRIRTRLRAHENPLVRKARLVNQVHDELLYEAPRAVAREVLEIVCWELEHAVTLRVPILADGSHGPSWAEAH